MENIMLKKTINRMALGILLSGAFLGSSTQMNAMEMSKTNKVCAALLVVAGLAHGYISYLDSKTQAFEQKIEDLISRVTVHPKTKQDEEDDEKSLYKYDSLAYQMRAANHVMQNSTPFEWLIAAMDAFVDVNNYQYPYND